MYEAPYLYNAECMLTPVTVDEVDAHTSRCRFRSAIPCDENVFDLCCFLLRTMDLNYPTTSNDGITLYLTLRERARGLLHL